jgi:F-type H+-transporting ATPase subunit b
MMTGMRFLSLLTLALLLAFLPVASFAAADSKVVVEEAPVVTEEKTAAPELTSPEAGDAHAAPAEEHGEGGLPQLNIATYPGQIFWLLVMFTVLYLAFSKSVLPAIGAVVHGRENLIKGNLDAAQNLKEQAQAIQAAYEKNLEAAKAQAVQAVQNVELAAKQKASDQVDAFRRKSEGEIKSAEDRVLIVKDKAMGDMSHVAAEVASIAAEKITGVGGDLQKAKAIVDSIASKAKAA